jgi:hypothetical protein
MTSTDSTHILYQVGAADLQRAITSHDNLYLSEGVRVVRGILLAIQRGEHVVIAESVE